MNQSPLRESVENLTEGVKNTVASAADTVTETMFRPFNDERLRRITLLLAGHTVTSAVALVAVSRRSSGHSRSRSVAIVATTVNAVVLAAALLEGKFREL